MMATKHVQHESDLLLIRLAKSVYRWGWNCCFSLILIFHGQQLPAASLRAETKAAWEAYLATRKAAMQVRLQQRDRFLWLDEAKGRREHVRTGVPYILPLSDEIPKPITAGLIHAWLGAEFIPNTTIENVLKVVRDYGHYAAFYRPNVIAAKLHRTEGTTDLFFVRLANRSVVSHTALDTEEVASYVKIDDHRWYGYSDTISVHEIAKLGTPDEHSQAEDEGTGLIWRLSRITRLQEQDGGVYVELEAYALSRDIPPALRLFVSPIIRRVSRDSLVLSLHQTRVAINSEAAEQSASLKLAANPSNICAVKHGALNR